MRVTEEEAKQKWCPMARVTTSTIDSPAFNRQGGDANCAATDCMMFEPAGTDIRWVKGDYGQGTVSEEVEVFKCGLSR